MVYKHGPGFWREHARLTTLWVFIIKSAIFQCLLISDVKEILAIKTVPYDKQPMEYLPQKFGMFPTPILKVTAESIIKNSGQSKNMIAWLKLHVSPEFWNLEIVFSLCKQGQSRHTT